jgi:hypothetical protein
MKNRKILGALCAVVVMAVPLIGCESSETTGTTAPEKVTTTTAKKASAIDVYVASMKVKYPNSSDAQLIDLGKTSCEVIDAFGSVADAIFAIAEDPTWDREMALNAGYTFGAAVPVFCPEYTAELKALVG